MLTPGGSRASTDTLDLQPGAPFDIRLGYENPSFPTGPRAIRFDTALGNVGTAPLDLLAVADASGVSATVSRCAAWLTADVCTERAEIAHIPFEAVATHWRFDGLLTFELRRASDEDIVVSRSAQLICLNDDAMIAGTQTTLASRRHVQCSPTRIGITPGWYTHTDGHPEQFVPTTGVPDGRYALVVRFDPAGLLGEHNVANNSARRFVDLLDEGTRLRVLRTEPDDVP